MAGREPLVSIARAREIVAAEVRPLASESVAMADALGRALAEEVRAEHDVPPFANSAMDGFAVRAGPPGRRLRLAGESRAGAPAAVAVGPDEAIRISTGAAIPAGADAVVALERAHEADGWVTLDAPAEPGLNVRGAGEDMAAGRRVLEPGHRLGVAELAVAVAAGRARLVCARRPRVAVVSSGDELRDPGAPLEPGAIHDSNAVALSALARIAGAELSRSAARVHDDRAVTEAALESALQAADVVTVTGGVSVGPHDHVKDALASLGVQQRFWGVALRPGKPTWFGVREGTLVFGLPGNPVSAIVTFLLFVRPALDALQGLPTTVEQRTVALMDSVDRHSERDQAVRVRLSDGPAGPVAHLTGSQGSHQLTSMLHADALVVIERGTGAVPAGTPVSYEPIRTR